MISGSHDTQTSADVSNVGTFQLPDPAGRAGGACTSALLQVLHDHSREDMSWVTLLRTMRTVLLQMGFDQVPQLTSSRMIDVNKTFCICPPDFNGSKRAVLIGINYTGQQGQLSGCHNDVGNILKYLTVCEEWCCDLWSVIFVSGFNHLMFVFPSTGVFESLFRRRKDSPKATAWCWWMITNIIVQPRRTFSMLLQESPNMQRLVTLCLCTIQVIDILLHLMNFGTTLMIMYIEYISLLWIRSHSHSLFFPTLLS